MGHRFITGHVRTHIHIISHTLGQFRIAKVRHMLGYCRDMLLGELTKKLPRDVHVCAWCPLMYGCLLQAVFLPHAQYS